MKLFLAKTNKLYNSLHQLPIQNSQKVLKVSKNRLSSQLDGCYQFFYKGKQLKAKQVQQLIDQNPQSKSWIIINQKRQKLEPKQEVTYESHRQVIERYIKQTKTNQKQKIKQNAEFIFQNAIDGNFKYHTFEYFQLEKQFTEQRKAQLLNEVFWKLCENQHDELNVADRKSKNQQKTGKNQKVEKVQSKKQKSNSISLGISKKQLPQQQDSQESQNEQSQSQNKKSQQVLQLHELEYINQNWKQLLCVNKYLLKTNLDNLKYYADLQQHVNITQKRQQENVNEKMEIQNVQQIVQKNHYNDEFKT